MNYTNINTKKPKKSSKCSEKMNENTDLHHLNSFWHPQRIQPPIPTPARVARIQRLAQPQGGLIYAAPYHAWLVTGYEAVNQILRARQAISTHWNAETTPSQAQLQSNSLQLLQHMMLFQNHDAHRRLRGLVEQAFTPRMIAEQHEYVQSVLGELISQLKQKAGQKAGQSARVDLVAELAHPFPTRVILGMLGLDHSDEARFLRWSSSMVKFLGGAKLTPELLEHIEEDARQIRHYFQDLAAELRHQPRSGLLSALAQAETENQRLSSDELLSNALLLLVAGHEAVSNLIPSALLELSEQPEAWAQLCQHPRHPNVANELLRVVSPAQIDGRIIAEPLTVQGHTLQQNDFAQLFLGAANRDPAVFPEPARLNWQRPNSARHLAFAAGPHFCLGASLARLEISEAFASLAQNFPDFRVLEQPPFKPNVLLRGPVELWVQLN